MPLLLHVRKYLLRGCLSALLFLQVTNEAMAQLKASFQADKNGGCSPLNGETFPMKGSFMVIR